MISTTVIPNTSDFKVSLDFPKEYLGEEIKIIAFKKEEGLYKKKTGPKRFASFDSLKIDTSTFKFNRDEANER